MVYAFTFWLHLVAEEDVLEEMAFVFHFAHCFGILVQVEEGDEDLQLQSGAGGCKCGGEVGGRGVALGDA